MSKFAPFTPFANLSVCFYSAAFTFEVKIIVSTRAKLEYFSSWKPGITAGVTLSAYSPQHTKCPPLKSDISNFVKFKFRRRALCYTKSKIPCSLEKPLRENAFFHVFVSLANFSAHCLCAFGERVADPGRSRPGSDPGNRI